MPNPLEELSLSAREVLEMAAVAGRSLDVPLLQRACNRSEEDVVRSLEEGAALGLLLEEDGLLVFAPGAGEALCAAQLGVRRALRFRRLAEAAVDPDQVAFFLGQAGAPEAVPQLRAAGDRAMRTGDRLRAREYYSRALVLSGSAPEPELLLLAAMACEPTDLQLLTEVAATDDPVVTALAAYQLALCETGGEAGRSLRRMDEAHKNLFDLRRDERYATLLELTAGRRHQMAGAPDGLALAYLWSGRPAEAEAIVRESLTEGGPAAQGALDQWVLGEAALLRGDLDEALRRYELSVEDAMARRDYAAAARRAGVWLDHLAYCRGDASVEALGARVEELSRVAVARAGAAPEPRYGLHYWRGDWERLRGVPGWWGALVAVSEGRVAAVAEGAPGRTPRYGEYGETMRLFTLQARACLLGGDLDGARAWLETVDAWHAGPRPSLWCYALNRVEWARFHMAVGDAVMARSAAEEALVLGERFGAPTALVFPALVLLGRVDEARDLAARVGPPQLARGLRGGGGHGLTPREAEIAALVAEGLTDREIGERLYISPRTVDGHLRNIFRKLDLTSRTALAAWAVRVDLLTK